MVDGILQLPAEIAADGAAVEIAYDLLQFVVDRACCTFGVDDDLHGLVPKGQLRFLDAAVFEAIDDPIPPVGIVIADEYDKRFAQPDVIRAGGEHVHVDGGLVVAHALGQRPVPGGLHLDVVHDAVLVLDVQVQPYPLCLEAALYRALRLDVGDLSYAHV